MTSRETISDKPCNLINGVCPDEVARMQEKRKSLRFALEVEIHWKRGSADENSAELMVSRTRNLSTGGACVLLPWGIQPGDTINMEIRLTNGESIYARGKIAWVSQQVRVKNWAVALCKGGVEFLDLAPSEREMIDQLIPSTFDEAA